MVVSFFWIVEYSLYKSILSIGLEGKDDENTEDFELIMWNSAEHANALVTAVLLCQECKPKMDVVSDYNTKTINYQSVLDFFFENCFGKSNEHDKDTQNIY